MASHTSIFEFNVRNHISTINNFPNTPRRQRDAHRVAPNETALECLLPPKS